MPFLLNILASKPRKYVKILKVDKNLSKGFVLSFKRKSCTYYQKSLLEGINISVWYMKKAVNFVMCGITKNTPSGLTSA